MKKKLSSLPPGKRSAIIGGVAIFIITTYVCLDFVAEAFVKAADASLAFYLTPSELKVITTEVYIKLLMPFAIYPVLGGLYVFFTRHLWSKKVKGILVLSSILLSFTPILLFLFLNNSPFVKYLGAKQAEKILERHDGLNVAYYPNGNLIYEENYKNGVRDGVQRRYYENGQLQEEGNYISGKREGLRQSFYKNGQLKCDENYKNDSFDGKVICYNTEGELIREEKWSNSYIIECKLPISTCNYITLFPKIQQATVSGGLE